MPASLCQHRLRHDNARNSQERAMQYEQLDYIPEHKDPSITLETKDLVVRVIDNSGLLLPANRRRKAYFGRYGKSSCVPFSHHLGYHGIRLFYNKEEKRNLVVPYVSWLNLQGVVIGGIENDPIDERAAYGVARGWPLRLNRKGLGAVLTIDPMPNTQFGYAIEFQPAEPDAIDFSIRFVFHRKSDGSPAGFRATWPCYMNAYDDVRFFYPRGDSPEAWEWASIGEKPDMIIGEPVNYKYDYQAYHADKQAMPVGYGRIGDRVFMLMFSDPRARFFTVNAGGHMPFSSVQNPAWDFEWVLDDYPLNEPVGFDGRIVYTRFENSNQVLDRYREWKQRSRQQGGSDSTRVPLLKQREAETRPEQN